MKRRSLKKITQAVTISEGAGVTVHRTIGTPALRNLDPFLLLDYFSSNNPGDYIAGFPDHPHRGFITLTYMLNGHMLHQDSMGNKGDLRSGSAQWMKAASGVIHSEMPQQSSGLMRGFQLWINLPGREKMSAPEYQDFSPNAIPIIKTKGVRVKLLSGQYHGHLGPINDPNSQVHYLDVTLEKNKLFSYTLNEHLQGFVYVFEGQAKIDDITLRQHTFAHLGDGDTVALKANDSGARFILVAGQPINEPIVQHGPFVMNTRKEIERAFADYRDGTLVRNKADFTCV
ncbi:MAG: pirin family protein [Gammaproteobacteria bacterium]|nr:pirin family protein [Gammaproteobacteria bacterium]